jgi:hypothetical protein
VSARIIRPSTPANTICRAPSTPASHGRKPLRTARRPKPPALADSAPAIINEIPGVIAADPTKKPSAEQTSTRTSNAENSAVLSPASNGDTARFHRHVRDCDECEHGNWRDGRLCPIGTLLARPRDLRIRARAPRMWIV